MQTTVNINQIIQLQARGVVTLPKNLREDLFDENRLAKVTRIGRKIILEPIRTLPYSVRSYTNSEVDSFFKLDDQETKKLKSKGLI